jgi:hypothetical protein
LRGRGQFFWRRCKRPVRPAAGGGEPRAPRSSARLETSTLQSHPRLRPNSLAMGNDDGDIEAELLAAGKELDKVRCPPIAASHAGATGPP